MKPEKKPKVSILDMNAKLPMDENGIIDWEQVEFPRLNIKSLDEIEFVGPNDKDKRRLDKLTRSNTKTR